MLSGVCGYRGVGLVSAEPRGTPECNGVVMEMYSTRCMLNNNVPAARGDSKIGFALDLLLLYALDVVQCSVLYC